MTPLRVALGIICAAILLVSHGIWTATSTSLTMMPRTAIDSGTAAISDAGADEVPGGASEPLVDLHGNEIETALGDYRIDPRGGVYEQHAPDTAVGRLAPPGV
jgi:hypothetical protein